MSAARDSTLVGLGLTALLHLGVVAVFIVLAAVGEAAPSPQDQPAFQSIEAGLAIKAKSASGKKTRMPTKEQPKPVIPDAVKVTRDDKPVDKPEKKPPVKPPRDDFEDVQNRMRQMSQNPGTDDEEVAGAADGSQWGTLERKKGHPYVGELIGRMTVDFEVPSVVTESGLETLGCVKLDPSGRIVARELDPRRRSDNHAFNSAVEDRLRRTTDMERPVPPELVPMLVRNFACVTYRI